MRIKKELDISLSVLVLISRSEQSVKPLLVYYMKAKHERIHSREITRC